MIRTKAQQKAFKAQEERRRCLIAALTLEPQTPEQLAEQLQLKPVEVRNELIAMVHLDINGGGLLEIDGGWVIV